MRQPKFTLITVLLVMLIPLGFIIGGSAFIRSENKKLEVCTETVTATVVSYDQERDDGQYLYTPVYEYTLNGSIYRSHTSTYSSNAQKKYPLSSTYELKVNPNDPTQFTSPALAKSSKRTGAILIILGIISWVLYIGKRLRTILLGSSQPKQNISIRM